MVSSESGGSTSAVKWAPRIVGTLLFLLLLLWLDLQGTLRLGEVASALGGADLTLVLFSIGLYVPFLIIKAARWQRLSTDMLMPMTWSVTWRIYAIGLAAGTFTPGQAGDTLKAWYMQRSGFPLGKALGASLLDRLFDVAGLALLGLAGVAVFGGRFASQAPALVMLTLVCALGLLFLAWERTRRRAIDLVTRRLSMLSSRHSRGESTSWSLRPATIAIAALLTFLSFTTSVFRVWLLAAAVGIWLSPLEVAGFVGLTTAAALVPISVGGVGTRDLVAALALAQLGYAPSVGVAISALILLLNLAQAVTGWLIWLRYRPLSVKAVNSTQSMVER